jgi:8-oxo-dGTP pyrophosphatase MutT (NUDIX family)
VERGEDVRQAARREFEEETGLQVEPDGVSH